VPGTSDEEADAMREMARSCMLECRHRNHCSLGGSIDVNGLCLCTVKGGEYGNDNDINRFVKPEDLIEQKGNDDE
jgi:riboflavin synthase alpha subunit